MALMPCPANCAEGGREHQKQVSAQQVGISAQFLRAQGVKACDQLWVCLTCGRVRHRIFDSFLLRFRMVDLGTYDEARLAFEPNVWLTKKVQRERIRQRNRE